jgi:hypothetical protein
MGQDIRDGHQRETKTETFHQRCDLEDRKFVAKISKTTKLNLKYFKGMD